MKSVSDLVERALRGTMRAGSALDAIRSFPVVDLDTLTRGKPMLVVAPHADDESLGCGGLIAEARSRAQRVHIVIVTDGTGSHPGSRMYPRSALMALREDEAVTAASLLGVALEHVTFLRLPDGAAPRRGRRARAATERIVDIARRIDAATIFSPWRHDDHPDHVAVAGYGRAAAKSIGATLFSYPVWGWMLQPDVRLPRTVLDGYALDVRRHNVVKRQAVYAHRSQTSAMIDDVEGFRLARSDLERLIVDHEFFIAQH